MLEKLTRLYDGYVDEYRTPDGSLPSMMRLKRIHTGFVVKNAELIADGEKFDAETRAETREAALAAALLHDTGRYEQLKLYNTFRDADSVDHAVFSHDIVKEKGWLDALVPDVRKRDAILNAVLYHNRRDIPEGLDKLTEACSHTVRDADKLDIFRVLEPVRTRCATPTSSTSSAFSKTRWSTQTGRATPARSGISLSAPRRTPSWSTASKSGCPSPIRT